MDIDKLKRIEEMRLIAREKIRKENQPMSIWLKEDAVKFDLPADEIICALCYEIEEKNSIIEQIKGLINNYADRFYEDKLEPDKIMLDCDSMKRNSLKLLEQ